jgi:EF hand domain-containing protein
MVARRMPSQPKGSAIVVGDRILGGAPRFAEGAPDEAFSFANVLAADMNRDGRISRDEAASFRPGFDWADENHDGLVTEDEWNARTATLRGRDTVVALQKPGPGDVAGPRVLWKSRWRSHL